MNPPKVSDRRSVHHSIQDGPSSFGIDSLHLEVLHEVFCELEVSHKQRVLPVGTQITPRNSACSQLFMAITVCAL